MESFWKAVDKVWHALASVKITFFVFIALFLLSFPGMLLLQENISNIDPGLQYSYDFWKWGQWLQIFTAYHSFWYVGLIALLSLNLVACSVERWPGMWKAATMPPRVLTSSAIEQRPEGQRFRWKKKMSAQDFQKRFEQWAQKKGYKLKKIKEDKEELQYFWEKHPWTRIANYLVHTSLLLIFAGAIFSSLYGFEGALNVPEGAAVDTFLLFKEGGKSGLKTVRGGLPNERLMSFRLEVEDFDVSFYKDFPGRPKEFISRVNFVDRGTGDILEKAQLRVNQPHSFKNFTFYQASYGRLGDYKLGFRLISKEDPQKNQVYLRSSLGEEQKVARMKAHFVPLRAHTDIQGLGPGVEVQELNDEGGLIGESFWVLKDYPEFDFQKKRSWGLVLDRFEEQYFTGLQVGSDPGAPLYWFGCFGMILGTFYALFFQHKKYHFIWTPQGLVFTASIHRLPLQFEEELKKTSVEMNKWIEA